MEIASPASMTLLQTSASPMNITSPSTIVYHFCGRGKR
ncbi:Protein of unknown function [Pyronema omphalodes CBS 100304]|uniref:Uncharacterized protein n=1 Tax=Pyronema omphalodes (strain CBS 100304) TaxID=1076935 RepID=U4LXI0_PYROM|nr:Protein of unknown function [Pyronema omphalodes CBS 100304]